MLKMVAAAPKRHPKTLYIFVDSQAAIGRLRGFLDLIFQVKNYCRALKEKGFIVYVQWCPSHKGIFGNEIADKLAKRGLDETPDTTPIATHSHLKRRARQATKDHWNERWTAAHHQPTQGYGKLYRWVLAGSIPKLSLKFRPFSKIRQIQAAYIQLRTGIGSLKTYLYNIRKVPNRWCWCCTLR